MDADVELGGDGCWIAAVAEIPAALVYRATRDEAISAVEALGEATFSA